MPLLSVLDPLPHRPRRVLVAGTSGAGKSTLVRRVATVLGVPHVELDALYHGPGWVPRETFTEEVRAFTAAPAWVCEWQYGAVRGLLAQRADLLVWLDHSRAVVMTRLVRRTLRRRLRRESLWNGNVEPPLRTLFTDRDHILRWAWRTHRPTAERVAALHATSTLVVVRLRGQREVDAWIGGPLRDSLAGDRPG